MYSKQDTKQEINATEKNLSFSRWRLMLVQFWTVATLLSFLFGAVAAQGFFDAHAGIAASHEILTDIIGIVSCNV